MIRSSRSSSSTVSSQDSDEIIRQQKISLNGRQRQENLVQESSFTPRANGFDNKEKIVHLTSCNDVTLRDRITNVYQSYYAKVMY